MARKREGSELAKIVGQIIEKQKNQKLIMPSWVAAATYRWIEPRNKATLLTKMAALLALKQIAREMLRDKFGADDNPEAQHPLFPDLNLRYPIAHTPDSEPGYIPLELMSYEDWQWNLIRYDKEIDTKQRKRDALENWGNARGYFLDKTG
jgi:hypothetical protein